MKIGIIGFGNLGRSLAEGLIKSKAAPPGDICACDSQPEAQKHAEALGLKTTGDINEACAFSDIIFLVVKGNVFADLAPGIDRSLISGKTVISFMAGVKMEKIRELIGGGFELVRAMPSLAISTCDGVIAYTAAPPGVSELFGKLGYAFEVKPEDIEKVMAFSSCGLGFAAYLIDAFAAAGEKLGFPLETCLEIASRTFKSAIERGDFKKTVKAVATKGGATEQGVLHMDAAGVYAIIAEAVRKAYEKMK